MNLVASMAKKKSTKLGAVAGLSNLESLEPRMPEYEKLRMKRIEENASRMEALGMKESAESMMAQIQNKRDNFSKVKQKKVVVDDELYNPDHDHESDPEHDSSNEKLSNKGTLSKQRSKYVKVVTSYISIHVVL